MPRRLMQVLRLKNIYCRLYTTVIESAQCKFPCVLHNLKVERINQVWAIDIGYIPIKTRDMYLLAIIDLESLYIIGWS